MISLLLLAVISPTQVSAPNVVVLSAHNPDRTFKVTLSLPAQSTWANDISGTMKLQNVSRESRYVHDQLLGNYAVRYENVDGFDIRGRTLRIFPGEGTETEFMLALNPGDHLIKAVRPYDEGWDFDTYGNGVCKVVIAFDDRQLWPDNVASQCIGRIAFPLTLRLTDEHLFISPRVPDSKETSRMASPLVDDLYGYQKTPSRRERARKNRRIS